MSETVPEFDALVATDAEFMAQFDGIEWRPRTSVASVEHKPIPAKVTRAYPLRIEVAWDDTTKYVFSEIQVAGLDPLDTTMPQYQAYFDLPREMVRVVDTDGGEHIWYALSDVSADQPSAVIRSQTARNVTFYRNELPFASPHPSGRPHELKVNLNHALLLGVMDPLRFQFPMVAAFDRSIGTTGEWGIGDGELWLPNEKPDGRDKRYGSALKDATRGFTAETWPTLLRAITGKFRVLDFDGTVLTTKAKVDRLKKAASGFTRGEAHPAKPAFDGVLSSGRTEPFVSFGSLGYFLYYYKVGDNVWVVVVDSGDGHKGLYVFAGEYCVEDAQDWATRGNGMNFKSARRRAVRWYPHTHGWRAKVVSQIESLLNSAPK